MRHQPVSGAGRQTVIVNPTIQPAESPGAAEEFP